MLSLEDGRIKQKSVNLSLRMNKEVYDILADHAKDQGLSLNSLINSITKRHLTWERFADEIGFVPITRRTLKKIFRELDEDAVNRLADDVGGTVPRELLYLSYGKMSFENLIKIIEINGTRFGKVRHVVNNSIHSINIHHGINEKFSKFLALTLKAFANDFSLKLDVSNIDRNMVCLEIEQIKN